MFSKIIKSILVLVVIGYATKSQAQFTGGLYTNGHHLAWALGYNIHDKFWADARFLSGYNLDSFTPEIAVHYNLVRRTNHDFYAGLGAIVNEETGLLVPFGLSLHPFEKLRNLCFDLEIKLFIDDSSDPYILGGFGLRYIIK